MIHVFSIEIECYGGGDVVVVVVMWCGGVVW